MDRTTFLRRVKDYDDNLCHSEPIYHILASGRVGQNITCKEFAKKQGFPLQWYSQIDYRLIERLTQRSPNPFSPLYTLSHDALLCFLGALDIASRFIRYFEERQFDRLRTREERMSLMKKYEAVIEDAKTIKLFDGKEIEILERRKKALWQAPTITKRRIYEDFIVGCVFALRYNRRDEEMAFDVFHPTRKEASIVNAIIGEYFQDETRFSEKTNFNRFKMHRYYIETAKADILLHS